MHIHVRNSKQDSPLNSSPLVAAVYNQALFQVVKLNLRRKMW